MAVAGADDYPFNPLWPSGYYVLLQYRGVFFFLGVPCLKFESLLVQALLRCALFESLLECLV